MIIQKADHALGISIESSSGFRRSVPWDIQNSTIWLRKLSLMIWKADHGLGNLLSLLILYGLNPSWIDAMCESHLGHWNGLSLSYIALTLAFSNNFIVNVALQISHVDALIPFKLWTVTTSKDLEWPWSADNRHESPQCKSQCDSNNDFCLISLLSYSMRPSMWVTLSVIKCWNIHHQIHLSTLYL